MDSGQLLVLIVANLAATAMDCLKASCGVGIGEQERPKHRVKPHRMRCYPYRRGGIVAQQRVQIVWRPKTQSPAD